MKAAQPALATLTLKGDQAHLDGKFCHIEIHPALAGLANAFAAGALDAALDVFRTHPPLLEAVRQAIVILTPTAKKSTYSIIGGLRPYLLLRALGSRDLCMPALVLPRLAEEALTPYLVEELFVAPLLLIMFNTGASPRQAEGGGRRHHRGNVSRALIQALKCPTKEGGPHMQQHLELTPADLFALGLDPYYYSEQLREHSPSGGASPRPPDQNSPPAPDANAKGEKREKLLYPAEPTPEEEPHPHAVPPEALSPLPADPGCPETGATTSSVKKPPEGLPPSDTSKKQKKKRPTHPLNDKAARNPEPPWSDLPLFRSTNGHHDDADACPPSD